MPGINGNSRRGRPPIHPGESSVQVCLRVPESQYDLLDHSARSRRVSIPALIRRRLAPSAAPDLYYRCAYRGIYKAGQAYAINDVVAANGRLFRRVQDEDEDEDFERFVTAFEHRFAQLKYE